jgi:hypothetical protein
MKISPPLLIPSAVTLALTAVIAVTIFASSFVVINAQLPNQQQIEPNEGLTAILNGDSFRTGDTITVSGSVEEGEPRSFVGIEVIGPQSAVVERGVSVLTEDNIFNYSFIAGQQKEVDIDEPMVTSGNYRMVVTYFPPGDPLGMKQAEINFEYHSINDTGDDEGAEGVTTSIQPATIETTTPFQSIDDGFRLRVPHGWIIQDVDNAGSTLSEATARGYVLLAQLCPDEEEQQQGPPSPNVGGDGEMFNCQLSENHVIHIVRYHDLATALQSGNNAAFTNNNITSDTILLHHLQKLQEVGYRDIEIVNSADMTVNLTIPQANETIAAIPAKFVEMTYTTASSAPDEIRTGYFISTATNLTSPDVGTPTGYTVFYEGRSLSVAEQTIGFGSLSSLPPAVKQVFDSFELLAAPEVEQAIAQQSAEAAAAAAAAEPVEGAEDEENDEDEGDDDEDEENDEDEGDDDEDEDEGDDDEDEENDED